MSESVAGQSPKTLSLDDLLAVDTDRKVEAVDVPEWGGRVFVRQLNAVERDKFEAQFTDEDGKDVPGAKDEYIPRVVAATLCDAGGKLLGVPAAWIAKKSPEAVRRVWRVTGRLNHLTREAADAGKGDFGETPAAG